MAETVVTDMKRKHSPVLNARACLTARRGRHVEHRVGPHRCEVNPKMAAAGIIVTREFAESCVNLDGKDFVGKIIS